MNWSHLGTFLWLRWRLRVNQIKRAGMVNAILTAMFVAAMIPGAVFLFAGAVLLGVFAMPLAPPAIQMFIWDGLVAAFLFSWAVGLLSELQRLEALSMDKFLHLPVSLYGVFLINYISSLMSLTLLLFVPALTGLILGLSIGSSPRMLALLPLLAAFLLAVTALTYQFQGWLASLMSNPRRRRTVIVFATMALILVVQVPNLINMMRPWDNQHDDLAAQQSAEAAKLQEALKKQEITVAEYNRRQAELTSKYLAKKGFNAQDVEQAAEVARIVNLVAPPGWLPLGAEAAAAGDVVPALLGTLGLGLIGTASLWRAYRTTIRLYQGEFTAGTARAAVAVAAPPKTATRAPAGNTLLERNLPWLSERASAIALGGYRALMRAPEVKMILVAPFIMLVFFGGMFLAKGIDPPEMARPFIGVAAMVMILLSMTQLLGNQFGFDRTGFRVFVLCPAPRRDILLGKNLAVAPVALGLGTALVLVVQVVFPMRFDHLLSVLITFVSMYLLYCLLANLLSILAPMPVAATSLKPVNVKALPILLHVTFAMCLPFVLGPVMLPLGVDLLLQALEVLEGIPVGLALAVLELALVVPIYRIVLGWQGALLQMREQKILEIVTTKAE